MPLDTSTRPELAALNQRIADIAAEREPLHRTYDELAPPVMRLQQLIIQHRSGMHQLRGDEDDDAYTGRLLELRQIEQRSTSCATWPICRSSGPQPTRLS